jgi:hypothetical protein
MVVDIVFFILRLHINYKQLYTSCKEFYLVSNHLFQPVNLIFSGPKLWTRLESDSNDVTLFILLNDITCVI